MATPPEEELLRACIRWSAGQNNEAELQRLAEEITDWSLFAANGLAPLAASCFRANGTVIPHVVAQELDRALRANAKRVLALTTELKRILALLENAGIPAIAVKGPVLAHIAYRDPAWREFTDLDIAVARDHLPAARKILGSRHYRPAGDAQVALIRDSFLWWHTELHLIHSRTGICVDLHWALLPRAYPARLPAAEMTARCTTVLIDGQPIPTLSPEDNLLYLCLHAEKHEWSNPVWVADICGLLSLRHDYKKLQALAQRYRAERALDYGLAQASAVLKGQPPPTVPDSNRSWRKLFYLLSLIFMPTEADWASLRLPARSLAFLYFPWRLLRLLARRFQYPKQTEK